MGTIITDLKKTFRNGNTNIRLIFINVAVFILTAIPEVILRLFNYSLHDILECLELPASLTRLLQQPWSLLTYMFMHADVLHLLINMLWLYWFGALFLQFFSARHLRGLYLLGGICGGLFFLLSFNLFPYFQPMRHYSMLLGASASVLSIVAAVAYREPNYHIQLFLLGSISLKYVALIVIGTDLLFITSGNGGGHIAHLGGALTGLLFVVGLNKGIDATNWINRCINVCTSIFHPHSRKPKMKVNYGSKRQNDYDYNAQKKAQADKIDHILDKLKKSGYESLTNTEKKSLFDASKR